MFLRDGVFCKRVHHKTALILIIASLTQCVTLVIIFSYLHHDKILYVLKEILIEKKILISALFKNILVILCSILLRTHCSHQCFEMSLRSWSLWDGTVWNCLNILQFYRARNCKGLRSLGIDSARLGIDSWAPWKKRFSNSVSAQLPAVSVLRYWFKENWTKGQDMSP